jgi:hypothetical protein
MNTRIENSANGPLTTSTIAYHPIEIQFQIIVVPSNFMPNALCSQPTSISLYLQIVTLITKKIMDLPNQRIFPMAWNIPNKMKERQGLKQRLVNGALTCFCLSGLWPQIQTTRFAGGR